MIVVLCQTTQGPQPSWRDGNLFPPLHEGSCRYQNSEVKLSPAPKQVSKPVAFS